MHYLTTDYCAARVAYMPLEVEFDAEIHAVVIRATGRVGAADFMNFVDVVVETPGFEIGMNQLLDLGAGALDLEEVESRNLAQFFQSESVRKKLGSKYKVALVAPSAVDFGVFRMFEIHDAGDAISIRVFYELKEARAWLLPDA